MLSKFGLLLGSSFQHSFIRLRHSAGASSTETTGLQRGGGFFRRSTISERYTGSQIHKWVVRPLRAIRQTGRRPVSPWPGMSIMAYGSVREITSCIMMEKLKTSPANEPPRTGFLKSSGAVHSSSERHREGGIQVGRQLLSSSATGSNHQFHCVSIWRVKNNFQTSHPVGPQEP